MPPDVIAASRAIGLVMRRLNSHIYRAVSRIKNLAWQAVKGPAEGWVTFMLVLLSVMVAGWSLERAQWVATPGLYGLALWSAFLGLVLAKAPLKGWPLAVSGMLLGIYLSFHQLTSLVEGATTLERYAEAGKRLFAWGQAFAGGEVRPDALLVTFFLLCVSWLAGFICSWSLFRRHNIWGALLPSGTIIAVNMSILPPGAQKLQLYLYLFVVCLLLVRLFVVEREHDWRHRNVQRLATDSQLAPKAFGVALAVVIVTSLLPAPSLKVDPVAAAWDRVSWPIRALGEKFVGVVRQVPVENPRPADSFEHTNPFGGNTTLREEPVLIVEAPFPIYLRARSYDVYTHRGWETGDTQIVSPAPGTQDDVEQQFQKLQQVEMTVNVLHSLTAGQPIYLAGYPIDMSIAYQLERPQPARYQIRLSGNEAELAAEAQRLPPDLRQAALQLQEMSRASGHKLTESDIAPALPADVRVVAYESGQEGVEKVTVERYITIPLDTLSVRTTFPISAGNLYQATSVVSTATDSDLLAAGTEYPGWVLDRYLQLPHTMPSRVMNMAQQLTNGLENPYQKATVICDYLRTLEYTLDIEAPPEGNDGVDYFLFDVRKGYCQYFASAMTVLLRASGVPSRMVVGYGPGELIEEYAPNDMPGEPSGSPQDFRYKFVVKDSHSWSEAFFPGYGWIPFEPTPTHPLITRGQASLPPRGGEGTGIPGEKPDGTETGIPWDARPLIIFLALALVGSLMWLAWRRLLGQVSEPRAAYARVGRLATLGGMGPKENLTPLEYGHKLAAAVPDIAAPLEQIIRAYVHVSYSKHSLNNEDRSKMAKAWPQLRNRLLQHALRSALHLQFRRDQRKS